MPLCVVKQFYFSNYQLTTHFGANLRTVLPDKMDIWLSLLLLCNVLRQSKMLTSHLLVYFQACRAACFIIIPLFKRSVIF